jgi:hypothetical protein
LRHEIMLHIHAYDWRYLILIYHWTRCTTFVSDLRQTGRWISPGTPVASTNKTNRHGITEILLKVALNTTKQTSNNIIQRNQLIPSTNTVWYEMWQQWLSHK